MRLITLIAALFAMLCSVTAAAAQSHDEGSPSQAAGGFVLGAFSGLFLGDVVDDVTNSESDSPALLWTGASIGAAAGAYVGATTDGHVENAGWGALVGFGVGAVIAEITAPESDTGPAWLVGGRYGAALGALIGIAVPSSETGTPAGSPQVSLVFLSF